jgi:hypothetical protein
LSNQEQDLSDKRRHCDRIFHHLVVFGFLCIRSMLHYHAKGRGKQRHSNGYDGFSNHDYNSFHSDHNYSAFHKNHQAQEVASSEEGREDDEQGGVHYTGDIYPV